MDIILVISVIVGIIAVSVGIAIWGKERGIKYKRPTSNYEKRFPVGSAPEPVSSRSKKVRYSSQGKPLDNELSDTRHEQNEMPKAEETAEPEPMTGAEQMSPMPADEEISEAEETAEPEPMTGAEPTSPEDEVPEYKIKFKQSEKGRMNLSRIRRRELSLEEEIRLRQLRKAEPIQNKDSIMIGSPMGDVIGLDVKFPPTSKRKVNVWMHNHDSHLPLILKQQYQLMINVGEPKLNTIMSANAERLEEYAGNELLVALVSDNFSIQNDTQKMTLPSSGNSESISFKVIPTSSGVVNIFALFYYKINLLQMLSITLNVLPKSEIKINQGKAEPLIHNILLTADRGFESIAEIRDQK